MYLCSCRELSTKGLLVTLGTVPFSKPLKLPPPLPCAASQLRDVKRNEKPDIRY